MKRVILACGEGDLSIPKEGNAEQIILGWISDEAWDELVDEATSQIVGCGGEYTVIEQDVEVTGDGDVQTLYRVVRGARGDFGAYPFGENGQPPVVGCIHYWDVMATSAEQAIRLVKTGTNL